MSSDVKIPDERSLLEIAESLITAPYEWQSDAILAVADALLAAEKRGRKAGVEEVAAQLPDEIDIYQTLKRSGLRRRADVAKRIAAAIRSLGEKI